MTRPSVGRERLDLADEAELLGRGRPRLDHAQQRPDRVVAEGRDADAADILQVADPPALSCRGAFRRQFQHRGFDIAARERGFAVEQADVAIDAHGRLRLRGEIEGRGAAPRRAQQALDAGAHAAAARRA
jgi:hypothetical protein